MSSKPGAISWRFRIFDSLPSTSDLVTKLACQGEPEGLAVLAREQTAGRGTRGRGWTSPIGNLFLSVLLRPAGPITNAGHWALLTGVALIEALSSFTPDDVHALTLKWPNDVLLRGRKLAGILMDSATQPGGRLDWLVVGIGANLASAPEVPGRATACLAELVASPAPERVAEALLVRLDNWLGIAHAEGFAKVRAAWLARAQAIGSALRLMQNGMVIEGSFAGLGDDGSLLLAAAGKVRSYSTGEVLLASQQPQQRMPC